MGCERILDDRECWMLKMLNDREIGMRERERKEKREIVCEMDESDLD